MTACRTGILPLLATVFLATASVVAQEAVVSPEVLPGGRVVFRHVDPRATRVELVGRSPDKGHDFPKNSYDLVRGAGDVWETTVGPLLPGLYLYRFRIDGTEAVDPLNGSVQNFFAGPWSKVEVPDPQPRSWHPRPDVPAGRVDIRRFGREAVGWGRPVCVYLPPGYDTMTAKLPVVYLLHGWDYDERAWIDNGLVPTILDNLIADGRARPMVVVMPLGFSIVPTGRFEWPGNENARWTKQLLEGLVPWIEANYRVAADREHRAVAGLSMGGKQSLLLGLGRPELFAWVGCFSSGKQSLANYEAGEFQPAMKSDAPKLRLVWLGSGQGDLHFDKGKQVAQKLKADGLPVVWHEVDGRHTWRVWRECFSEFSQAVFQPAPQPPAGGR